LKSFNRISLILLTTTVFAVGLSGVAQGAMGLFAIEPRLGYVNPESDMGGTFMLAVTGDLGTLSDQLRFEGTIDFWKKSYDMGGFGGSSEWSYTNIGFIGCARYDFPTEGTTKPFGFAGVGLHMAKASGETSYRDPISGQTVTDSASDSSMEFGFQLGGGVELPMGSNNFVGRVGMDFNGGADYMFFTVGLRLPMGGGK